MTHGFSVISAPTTTPRFWLSGQPVACPVTSRRSDAFRQSGHSGGRGTFTVTPHLELRGADWAPRLGPAILHDISFGLQQGSILGVVGQSGAGKSTLLRLIYRYLRLRTGQVLQNGCDIWAMEARDAVCQIAAVLQEQVTDFALTVAKIVALGRAPHHRGLSRDGLRDAAIVADAIDQLGLGPLAQRRIGTLSSGARQRVMVARALAQEPKLLVLDEPTNHLDIRHQLEVLALIRNLCLAIIGRLHDLRLAAQVCDEIALLNVGRVVAHGPQAKALHSQTLGPVFGVTVTPDRLALSDRNHLTFHLDTQKEPS